MIYYFISSFTIICILIIAVGLLFSQFKKEQNTKIFTLKILTAIILALVFKFSWGYDFYGMEYEDAYVFTNSANELAHNIYTNSFLTNGTTIGSIDNSIEQATYGGHFIAYPTYLSWFIKIFGFSQIVLNVANLIISLLIILLLSFFPFVSESKNWLIAPLVFCVAPIINIFSTSFLSEQFSSFCCLTFLFAFFYWYKHNTNKLLACVTIICFFSALLCKRENLLLIIVPVTLCVINIKEKKFNTNVVYISAAYISTIVLYLLFIQNVFNIEAEESFDIQQSTFGISFFVRQLPVYLTSLFKFSNFSVVLLLTLVVIISSIRHLTTITISVSILLIGYICIYPAHYRGYFYINNEMGDFETFRYINNYFYLTALVIGSINYSKIKEKIIVYILLALLPITLYQTINFRKHFSTIEFNDRWALADEIIAEIEKGDLSKSILITDHALLFLNRAPSNFNICSVQSLSNLNLNNTDFKFYLESPEIDYLSERYGIKIDLDNFKPILYNDENSLLYLYSPSNINN